MRVMPCLRLGEAELARCQLPSHAVAHNADPLDGVSSCYDLSTVELIANGRVSGVLSDRATAAPFATAQATPSRTGPAG